MRVPLEDIIRAYEQTGSVWKAGKAVGLSGQTVHDRLRAHGVKLSGSKWAEDELDELRSLVGEVTIGEAAQRLGRTYAAVACKVSELGIGSNHGNRAARKIPRGRGYDKASLHKYMKQIDTSGMTVHQFARANRLQVETLCQALERSYPEWWVEYRRSHSDLPEKACEYCERVFVPSNKKQRFCSRKCGSDSRTDESYFGGKRRYTIGLAERTCQLCERKDVKGLSSHHVLGKENDPDNNFLIALCPGCHQIITIIAGRNFVEDHEKWEAIIQLCIMRKRGETGEVYSYVEMEFTPESEMDEESV